MVEAEFKDYVANFVIPTENESSGCEVEVTVNRNSNDYDFFVYYLTNDCTDETFAVTFKKQNNFWGRSTLAYSGDRTTKTFTSTNGWRKFALSTEEDSSVVAYAVKKSPAKRFKSKSHPRANIVEVDTSAINGGIR